jgi:hypothetical protein
MTPAELHDVFKLITLTRNSIAAQFENLTQTLIILDKLLTKLKDDLDPGGLDA